jgi:Domain of unknown function (DUF397)
MTLPQATDMWRKSSRSAQETACVELAPQGLVRDSKNPGGPVLPVSVPALLAAVKAGRIGS